MKNDNKYNFVIGLSENDLVQIQMITELMQPPADGEEMDAWTYKEQQVLSQIPKIKFLEGINRVKMQGIQGLIEFLVQDGLCPDTLLLLIVDKLMKYLQSLELSLEEQEVDKLMDRFYRLKSRGEFVFKMAEVEQLKSTFKRVEKGLTQVSIGLYAVNQQY
eukprot:TRINITY_DN12287_c0_g1_i1.p2 TRINITY_DN12287_c0_g1~~TRINITY_DN12287_c0_g1_i1.p2  ORF type:complete len:161 (+),score=32.01 TRINITY_DN12287_c0_g1_i1:57-539(+)